MKKNFLQAISLALLPAVVLAHGGGHIQGTIAQVDAQAVVVKRADGVSQAIPLTDGTVYKVGAARATRDDMRVGSRVVVHLGHDGKAAEVDLPAHK